MVPIHIPLMGEHQRDTAVACMWGQDGYFLIFLADRTTRALDKVQRSTEVLDAVPEKRTAHLHIGIRVLPLLTDDIVEIDLALIITEIESPYIRTRLIACECHLQFRSGMLCARLDDGAGKAAALSHHRMDPASGRSICRSQLDIGQRQLCTIGNRHLKLLCTALTQFHHMMHALPCRCRKLYWCSRQCEPIGHRQVVDPQPTPCRHRDAAEYIGCCHHPIAPSNSILTRLFISTAYSSGSSFAIGSTKPRTIIARASSSSMPRLIR